MFGMLALASLLGKTTAQREEREVERDQAEHQVRASEQRFKALVHNASEIVQTINIEGVLTYVSPAIEAIMGYTPEEMVGRDGLLYVHPDDLTAAIAILGSVVQDPSLIATHELRLRHADGTWHWHEAQCRNLLADPFVGALVVNQRDITERKTLEEKLRYQASHDVLTGLPNRALFSDRLEHALGRRERTGETLVVMLLDLDDFKSVNDTLGHHAGDNLLVNVAESLRTATRPGDTVCRLGGDEFAVLLESLPDRAAGEIVAPRIIDCFSNALRSAQRNTSVGASIGIAFSMTGATDAAELLRNADIAMYAAKASGKGSHQIYESDMDLPAGTRAQVRGDRLHAVHQGGGLPE
jgi:diguanylate cyclase (GGDEF)-like protein/PAS domain S-box-containing protein